MLRCLHCRLGIHAAYSLTTVFVHAAQLRIQTAGGELWWLAVASPTSPQCPARSQACACGSQQLPRDAAIKQLEVHRGAERLCGTCIAGIVKAMREQVDDIRAAKLKIFVRRGGPQVRSLAQRPELTIHWSPRIAGLVHADTGALRMRMSSLQVSCNLASTACQSSHPAALHHAVTCAVASWLGHDAEAGHGAQP